MNLICYLQCYASALRLLTATPISCAFSLQNYAKLCTIQLDDINLRSSVPVHSLLMVQGHDHYWFDTRSHESLRPVTIIIAVIWTEYQN